MRLLGLLVGCLLVPVPALAVPTAAVAHVPAITVCALRLDSFLAKAGSANHAHVTVSSGVGTPRGSVTITVVGHRSVHRKLHGGHAAAALPRSLPAGHTYLVVARYHPRAGSGMRACVSPTRTYSVASVNAERTLGTLPLARPLTA